MPVDRSADQSGRLVVSGLAVDLGGRRVLHDVDLTVDPGQFVGLVGPNGAGKTTLLRSILGLLRPAAGRVEVAGRTGRAAADEIGYVPQRHEFAWEFPISVHDVVMTGRVRRIGWLRRPEVGDFRAVAEALELARMTDLARRPVGQLSGGQRQRVLVARALAAEPSVLLLDEPFTGLDMPTQELLIELFQRLSRDGRAVVMSTHDLAGAMHVCDRLCLVNRTVIAVGSPDELVDQSIWMRTFGVTAGSPLLRSLGIGEG
ncbi:anchored repeat-type ABC transporter ATP-binding subunit [Nakamurella leprariae]|uniref:Anchored repeat-type ABC transporter ATP-binding subunit n=1 Tax=Nakamurella leprariae TaxID=2803911 RepID=A0A939C3Q8_9ACTN|nr:anchored repeat-type ABC transporter ATP-binding subunit [Nakamurella leprariae]